MKRKFDLRVGFCLYKEEKQALEKLAQQEQCSLSFLIRKALLELLRNKRG